MPADTRYRLLAIIAAMLGVMGILLAILEFMNLPEPQGDGLPTFFGGVFALLFFAGALAALVEAGLLAAAVTRSDPGPWSRGLLGAGAMSGGLATLPRALGTAEFIDLLEVGLPWVRAWTLLSLVGVVCAGVGVLAHAVEPVERPLGKALGVGVLVLIGVLVAWTAGASVPVALVYQAPVLAVFCAVLGGVLHATEPLDRLIIRGALGLLTLLGAVLAVWQLLVGHPADATLVALGSLATLWALAATVDPGRVFVHA